MLSFLFTALMCRDCSYWTMHVISCVSVLSLMSSCVCSLQHGRRIETMVAVIDFENLSIQRHYYWPGIEALKAVRTHSNYWLYIVYLFILSCPIPDPGSDVGGGQCSWDIFCCVHCQRLALYTWHCIIRVEMCSYSDRYYCSSPVTRLVLWSVVFNCWVITWYV